MIIRNPLVALTPVALAFGVMVGAAGPAIAQDSEALRAIPFCATGGQSSDEIMDKVRGEGWLPVAPEDRPLAAMMMADATFYRADDPSTDGDLFAKRRAHAETMLAFALDSGVLAVRESAILVLNRSQQDDGVIMTRCDLFYMASDMSTDLLSSWDGRTEPSGVQISELIETDLQGHRNSVYDNVYTITRYVMPEGTSPPQTTTDYMLIRTFERRP